MAKTKFNLATGAISVQPSEQGFSVLLKHHNDNNPKQKIELETIKKQADEEGFIKMNLAYFLTVFGESLGGDKPPLVKNEIILE